MTGIYYSGYLPFHAEICTKIENNSRLPSFPASAAIEMARNCNDNILFNDASLV